MPPRLAARSPAPTITSDEAAFFPGATPVTESTCRANQTAAGLAGLPTVEQIQDDLRDRIELTELYERVQAGFSVSMGSPENPDDTGLLPERNGHPPAKPFDLVADGIRFTQFAVDDVHDEFARMTALGERFIQEPTDMGPRTAAVFDDTCGNVIQFATPPALPRA